MIKYWTYFKLFSDGTKYRPPTAVEIMGIKNHVGIRGMEMMKRKTAKW